jgi:hypothetical protein
MIDDNNFEKSYVRHSAMRCSCAVARTLDEPEQEREANNLNNWKNCRSQPEKTTCSIVLRIEGHVIVAGNGRVPAIKPVLF